MTILAEVLHYKVFVEIKAFMSSPKAWICWYKLHPKEFRLFFDFGIF